MTTLADPDTRFPGLPDGLAYDVAAVVAGLPALVEHLRSGGCPAPSHPEALRSVLDDVEYAAFLADRWTDALRDEVFAAVDRIDQARTRKDHRRAP